jgi:hypothetical protein
MYVFKRFSLSVPIDSLIGTVIVYDHSFSTDNKGYRYRVWFVLSLRCSGEFWLNAIWKGQLVSKLPPFWDGLHDLKIRDRYQLTG